MRNGDFSVRSPDLGSESLGSSRTCSDGGECGYVFGAKSTFQFALNDSSEMSRTSLPQPSPPTSNGFSGTRSPSQRTRASHAEGFIGAAVRQRGMV